jgi:hypothetical protein
MGQDMHGKVGSYINLPSLEVSSISSLLEVKAFSEERMLERFFSVSAVSSSSMIVEDELVVVFSERVDGVFSRINK